jgi:hypothetical protein
MIHSIKNPQSRRRSLQATVIVWSKTPINVSPKAPLMCVSFPCIHGDDRWPFESQYCRGYIDEALSQAQWVLLYIGDSEDV